VFGVIAGAWAAAWFAAELRWEAFDDDHEMRRHLVGACLMGVGGILAGGCTIGQGITAGSMLALSWPIAVGIAFSSEVDAGSRQENASNKKLEPGSASIRTNEAPAVVQSQIHQSGIVLIDLNGDAMLLRARCISGQRDQRQQDGSGNRSQQ
jgi:hypothetical protein